MRITKVLIGVLIVAITACTKTKETPSGLKFTILKSGDGVASKTGQIVAFNFLIKDSKDSVWADTYDRGYPEIVEIRDSSEIQNEDGLMQMIRMLSKGDSVTCAISTGDLFKNYAKAPMPPGLDSTLTINYNISVSEVMNSDQFEAYRTKINTAYAAKMEAKEKAHSAEQLGKDLKLIDEYLESKSIKAMTLDCGIRYVITQEGLGPKADSGQVAMIDYAGYLLDGTYFDTSIKSLAQEKGLYDPAREQRYPYAPMEVTVGSTPVIKGWHEAIQAMNKGAKATFYIPSTLAYGSQRRSEVIGENEILVFDLELVELKNEESDSAGGE